MKRTLVINGHPDKESYNYALSAAYLKGLQENSTEVKQINIADLEFDANLQHGYRQRMNLEADLEEALAKIQWAEHIVWFYPMWWYGSPALMKGFIDRAFLPGLTYEFEKGKALPNKLLKGRSARIVITADTPGWFDHLFMGRPAIRQFKRGTLQFCGISPVKVSYIAPVKNSSDAFREKWLQKMHALGQKGK